MNPADLDLPPKFGKWRRIDDRRNQYDAIVAAACSNKRVVIINAPTGTGKTTIYMGLAALLGSRAIVLTQTKGLSTQIFNDFHSMGMVEIKGQSNYPCRYFDDDVKSGARKTYPGCDEGPCHAGIECALKARGCHYYDAVRTAAKSKLVVTNYAYWMTTQKYADPTILGPVDTLILDEAHETAAALSEFVRITIVRKDVEKLLEMQTPRGATIDEWVDWAGQALKDCRIRLESARNSAAMYHQGVKVVRKLKDLESSLADLVLAGAWKRTDTPDPPAWVPGTATDWIIEETKKDAVFQPVWASGYSEQYLFAGIKKIILVSATVTPRDAGFLGLSSADYDYLQYPSPFKRQIRPVYAIRSAKVGRHMTVGEERMWVNRIDEIIEKEAIGKRVKGIIHARSYERARLIFARSRFRHLLIVHDARNTRDTVARFKRADPPCVLLSPAVSTGYDFPMDEARFQIIAKIPFIDNRPAVIKARHKADKGYLDYVALVELIQMAGRGVRSDKDFCNTYICDDNWIDWFYSRNRRMVPRWFREAVKKINDLSEVA